MNCEYCQSPVHIWIDCAKKPAGWKTERLAKKSDGNCEPRLANDGTSLGVDHQTQSTASEEERITLRRSAKSTSLPVDTKFQSPETECFPPFHSRASFTSLDGVEGDIDRQPNSAALAQLVEVKDLKSEQVSVRPREAAPNSVARADEAILPHTPKQGATQPVPDSKKAVTKFDKVSYMRSYMVKWRAAKKAKADV